MRRRDLLRASAAAVGASAATVAGVRLASDDETPNVLGLEHLTGFGELAISTSGDATTLRVDAETTSAVSVRAEAEVSRAELVALRREIDAALRENY